MKATEDFKKLYSEVGGLINLEDVKVYSRELLTEFVNILLEDRFDLFKMPDGFERHFCDDGEFLDVKNVKEELNNFLKNK